MSLPGKTFVLKSSNEDFLQRQKNVFDQLNSLQTNLLSPPEEMQVDVGHSSEKKSNRAVTKHFRGKESIFKRPQEVLTKSFMRKMPDFKKNPHRWVKYSLEDVSQEDMSEKSNTKAALSFLNELQNRKNQESKSEMDDEPKSIVFRKVTTAKIAKSDEETKASFRSSKVVMPEYVVGQKVRKEKKNAKTNCDGSRSSQLKLDHLFDEDESV